ncbi:hypothetical protein [Micromonospora sp. WMMC273]|uniref:hypothetical protein n=1 Tax=Micromonospora sp. WMMC273 TaxID=3015157 RepID=UPI0022B63275|nr:hypothetical protein [Micromonospora sp. WMMC273]MCZ7478925.1 hypothetical protein [Micromonospora sp. WMMC273]MCZ7478986.1 hypothetical protein [Micromonospora sp. WMMC273]
MFALLTVLIAGMVLLISGERPRSVTTAMPALVLLLWEIGLVGAGVIGLMGVTWRGQLSTGLAVELLGLILLGSASTMYAVAVYVVSGWGAVVAGSYVIAAAGASWWRAGQIVRDLSRVARAASRGYIADVPLLVQEEP